MLVLNLGVPPTEFTWTEYNAKGEPVSTETYTPLSFLKKYGDEKLIDNYVMLMNDPSREYYKCYEIDYDRHRYERQKLDVCQSSHRGYQRNGYFFSQG